MSDEKKVDAPLSAFTAADNIKYRKYQNRNAAKGTTPLARLKWKKAGRPER